MADIMQRVKLLKKADAQLKLVIGKIRPHPTKLECAEAFDPLLELANKLRADLQEADIVDMMRDFLLDTIAPCGDSLQTSSCPRRIARRPNSLDISVDGKASPRNVKTELGDLVDLCARGCCAGCGDCDT